jgi:hypothetical protein
MTRRRAKKHPKLTLRKRTRKITGTVINLTAQRITLQTAEGLWIFRRTSNTKVISGTLRRGSTVTVEFNRQDGKKLEGGRPGKRTEAGTVLKSNARKILLCSIAPDPGLWEIKLTDDTTGPNDSPLGPLSVGGSIVVVEFNEEDGEPVEHRTHGGFAVSRKTDRAIAAPRKTTLDTG